MSLTSTPSSVLPTSFVACNCAYRQREDAGCLNFRRRPGSQRGSIDVKDGRMGGVEPHKFSKLSFGMNKGRTTLRACPALYRRLAAFVAPTFWFPGADKQFALGKAFPFTKTPPQDF
ncbi:hypothetical protein O181_001768 [Austropuccinia psidii MF-1]|uniref:Uncharacterized protein n=1 Tax=Austropuccinia psidii MF-1 TaxID=1389203 RepID=A0A9Q3GC09_9BASI|nr:hypothetical protein [Austropuccinia psidii MF-1]